MQKLLRHLLTIFLIIVFFQDIGLTQSHDLFLRGQWDDNSLPTSSGITFNEVWGYAIDNREYGIMGSLGGTYFIDITIPATPIVADYETGKYQSSVWRDIKTYQHYAYVVADAGSSSLQVFDLSHLPDSVKKVYDSDVFFARAHNIFIDETAGILYACGTSTQSNGLILLDIQTDPANPSLLLSINLGHYTHDLYVKDNIAYCFGAGAGVFIYDFSNTSNVQTIGAISSYQDKGYSHSGWLSEDGQYLIMADETHDKRLKIADISNLNSPQIVSLFKSTLDCPTATGSITHNPIVKGDYIYCSYYHDGVQLFDMSNPLYPNRIAYYDTEPGNTSYSGFTGCWGIYPFLPSGLILASDVKHGLFILEHIPSNTPKRIYVDQSVTEDDQLGYCWNNAFKSLANALHYCNPGDSLLIAAGTYFPESANRDGSFLFSETITILGGFPSGGSSITARNPVANPTVLSGDIGILGSTADNVFHVVKVNSSSAEVVLDGIQISGGNANGSAMNAVGSAIYNEGKLYLKNIVLSGNSGTGQGSIVFNSGPNAILTLDQTQTDLQGSGNQEILNTNNGKVIFKGTNWFNK